MQHGGAESIPEMFGRHARHGLEGTPGYITNWLGAKDPSRIFGHAGALDGKVVARAPIPDDGVYGGALEYASLLLALETRKDCDFTMVELGAGWGPWVTNGGIAALAHDARRVRLVAVEASAPRMELLRHHLDFNGLAQRDDVEVRTINAAAWTADEIVYFPSRLGECDHGAAATRETSEIDYRGLESEVDEVHGLSIPTICADLGVVDYMHWDIQGAEYDVASASVDFLNANVRSVFFGTHSRLIEGQLTELMHGAGWELLWEKACEFRPNDLAQNLTGMTTTDGDQFWINRRMAA